MHRRPHEEETMTFDNGGNGNPPARPHGWREPPTLREEDLEASCATWSSEPSRETWRRRGCASIS
jgi:hypothetical protein